MQEKPQLSTHSVTLSDDTVATLQRLSQSATDFFGRSISISAILRALIRCADTQGPSAVDAVFVEVEREAKEGIIWGKKK